MPKIFAVTTEKGGVLKTSIVTNLAGILANEGEKVLIIDTDPQGDVCLSYGINPDRFKNTLYDVLIEGVNPEEVLVKPYNNISILPANNDMAFFEMDLLSKQKASTNYIGELKKVINGLIPNFDRILIDCPPGFGLITGNILFAADEVILPFQPEPYSMRSLQKAVQKVDRFRAEHNKDLKIAGVVGTLIDSRTNLHKRILKDCRDYCESKDIKMFNTKIPRSIQYAATIASEQKPITLTTGKKNRFYRIYSSLAREVF